LRKAKVVTVEIVKACDLKIGDNVLWANHEVEVVKIEGSVVTLRTWYDWKKTEFVYYYRVIPEKVVFS